MEKEFKIGFIVEGDTDRIIVETVAQRVLPPPCRIDSVRLGGKVALPSAHSTVNLFIYNEYAHVVLVVDADCAPGEGVERERLRIEGIMRSHQLSEDEVTVCLAVPTIEAWLLAQYDSVPETVGDPKKVLRDKLSSLDQTTIERLAHELDIPLARRRSPSFDRFISVLERINESRTHASAA